MSQQSDKSVSWNSLQLATVVDQLALAYKTRDKGRLPNFEYHEEAKRFYFGYCSHESDPMNALQKEIDIVNDATVLLKF